MKNFFFYIYDEETGNSVPVPVDELDIEDKQELEFFYDNTVRKVWNPNEEEWYFSIVDVCQVLTDSVDATSYWRKLKQRLLTEGNETVTNCHGLKKYKMKASDGKMRFTDCTNTEQLLRIIQSIPSKKAEPFKQWLARVGKERLDEMINPELAFERAIRTYREKGYTEKWIEQRLHAIDVRKQLTAEWDRAGVKQPDEYATLTNILTKAWAGNARRELEKSINQSVISPLNASIPDLLEISEEEE